MKDIFKNIKPVDASFFNAKLDKTDYTLLNKISFPKNELPNTKIALLGIGEGLVSLRKSLYEMYFYNDLSISDLGNIAISDKSKLLPILKTLLSKNIFTILIGNTVDVSDICFDALVETKKNISASIVTPSIRNTSTLSRFLDKKDKLFNLNLLGYQTYLSDPAIMKELSSNYFETLRLGKLREDSKSYEPALRDSDFLTMDLASIKRSEIPDSSTSGVNGLYSEEICLISRYAGISDNLKIVNLFNNNFEEKGQLSELTAQIIWHIVDGYVHRAHENMLNNVNGIEKILVNLESPETQLVFYHSRITNRWWMEVQGKKPTIVACSDEDYKTACKHDIPLRWVWYQQKMTNKN